MFFNRNIFKDRNHLILETEKKAYDISVLSICTRGIIIGNEILARALFASNACSFITRESESVGNSFFSPAIRIVPTSMTYE